MFSYLLVEKCKRYDVWAAALITLVRSGCLAKAICEFQNSLPQAMCVVTGSRRCFAHERPGCYLAARHPLDAILP